MPIVQVNWKKGRTLDQKKAVTKAITDVIVNECGVKPESVYVLFYDIEPEDLGHAGIIKD